MLVFFLFVFCLLVFFCCIRDIKIVWINLSELLAKEKSIKRKLNWLKIDATKKQKEYQKYCRAVIGDTK